ncbi:hypothetical protein THAR02_09539 [Trichoderma harzianum]|uniref:Uncharacterized protein n=1 Tax=Trichoderma harzianum TaxID=5544 RepID=A0A0F9ZYR4_TRIHA|nr:hypothetical protein THAR02_09539 [Trichoderma harzianum]
MAIQPGSIKNHWACTDNYEAPQPPQSRIDPSAYVDAAAASSQPQVELETQVQQAPTALPASPDGHLTAASVSSDADFPNYNPASYGGFRTISYTGISIFTPHISRLFHNGISTFTSFASLTLASLPSHLSSLVHTRQPRQWATSWEKGTILLVF